MSNYEKPIVLANSELSEGVYAASGTYGFNNANADIHQRPETGRGNYVLNVGANQQNGEMSYNQTVTLTFNQPVTVVNTGNGNTGVIVEGDGTNTVTIKYSYTQNPNDNFRLSDFIVESDPGLEVLGASSTYQP